MRRESEEAPAAPGPVCTCCGREIKPGERTTEDGRRHWVCSRPPPEPLDDGQDDLPPLFI